MLTTQNWAHMGSACCTLFVADRPYMWANLAAQPQRIHPLLLQIPCSPAGTDDRLSANVSRQCAGQLADSLKGSRLLMPWSH